MGASFCSWAWDAASAHPQGSLASRVPRAASSPTWPGQRKLWALAPAHWAEWGCWPGPSFMSPPQRPRAPLGPQAGPQTCLQVLYPPGPQTPGLTHHAGSGLLYFCGHSELVRAGGVTVPARLSVFGAQSTPASYGQVADDLQRGTLVPRSASCHHIIVAKNRQHQRVSATDADARMPGAA